MARLSCWRVCGSDAEVGSAAPESVLVGVTELELEVEVELELVEVDEWEVVVGVEVCVVVGVVCVEECIEVV